MNLSSPKDYPKFYFAGFWRRFSAFFIDFLILAALLVAEFFMVMKSSEPGKYQSTVAHNLSAASSTLETVATLHFATIILFMLYMLFMHKTKGATLGKMIARIKVLRMDGNRLTYHDAAVRILPFIAVAFICFIAPLGFSNTPTSIQRTEGTSYSSQSGKGKFVSIKPISARSTAADICDGLSLLWLIGSGLCIAVSRYRQSPHDLLAKTVVIKV